MKKNVYIPPLRPPALIVTRKPIANSFEIPLTKTIQVSPGKPKLKSTGYIRKNLVKIHATRTTTPSPPVRTLAALAESTVQSLLNFTPSHEDWRPKSFTTSHPAVIPNPYFGRNLGPTVEKQLNYTGVRYGKVNTVLESMPQNGAAIKFLKNESNFVMRFTPEDVKFTAVNINSENSDSPFHVDTAELKHLQNEFKGHRTYSDVLKDAQKKDEDHRKEVNIPYQGHKTAVDRPLTINNHAGNPDNSKGLKTVFDTFSSVHKSNNDPKLESSLSYQGHGQFLNDPFRPQKGNSATRLSDHHKKQDGIFQTESFGSQKIKSEIVTGKPSIKEFSNQFIKPANTNKINKDVKPVHHHQDFINKYSPPFHTSIQQQDTIESSNQKRPFPDKPHQSLYYDPGAEKIVTGSQRNKNIQSSVSQIPGYNSAVKTNHLQHSTGSNPQQHSSGINSLQHSTGINSQQQYSSHIPPQHISHQQSSEHKTHQQFSGNSPQQIPFFDNVSRKPVTESENNKDDRRTNTNFWGNPTKIGPKNVSSNSGIPTISGNNKNGALSSFPHSGTYRYNSLSNLFKNNSTQEQSAITISEFPLTFGAGYNKNSSKQTSALDFRNTKVSDDKDNTVSNFQEFDSHNRNPNLHIVSISHEDVSNAHSNQNSELGNTGRITSKPVFEQEHKLKEIELKNPPKYLQFGHEDFVKPVTVASFDNNEDVTKELTPFPFSARDKSLEILPKQTTDTSSETEKKLPKFQNSLSPRLSASKVEYDDSSESVTNKPSSEEIDDVYFQPVFPGIAQEKSTENSQQKFQNYNSGESIQQSSSGSKEGDSKSPQKPNLKPPNLYDKSKDKYRNTVDFNDVIIITNPSFSPEDTKRNVGRAVSLPGESVNDIPQVITPPPVITLKYDSADTDGVLTKKGNLVKRVNRTDNYVIQRKPALVPERDGKARKPKITISTGMLAGILIAALVFLGFLTGM